MAAFNKVILIGYLTDTPELKQTQTGISVASFTIGVNRRYSAEGKQETDFINIVCWRKTAEFLPVLRKGQRDPRMRQPADADVHGQGRQQETRHRGRCR